MSFRTTVLLLSFASFLYPVAAAASAEAPTPAELDATVPELMGFHEVVFQLWHRAWPDGDTAMIKELLPAARDGVRDLEAAELPGILRDRKPEWDRGIEALRAALQAYSEAAAADDGPALLDAVEVLHARFEDLVRLVRPVMPELEAYHRVLYRIFHYDLPNRDQDRLRQACEELTSQCLVLQEAPVPERFASLGSDLRTGSAELCVLSEKLRKTAGEGDWDRIEPAVDRVHRQYLKVVALFE